MLGSRKLNLPGHSTELTRSIITIALVNDANPVTSMATATFLLLAASAVLIAQSNRLDKTLAFPSMTAPPVIVLVPANDKVSAILLATSDLPAGTNVLPVVTNGKERTILPAFRVSGPGAYRMATVPPGADMIAYVTPPTGTMYRLRSTPMLRGYQYDGNMLTIYGSSLGPQTLVYIGTSLMPVKPVVRPGYIELSLKPTGAVTTLTVYQGEGLCDSVLVRLKQVVQSK